MSKRIITVFGGSGFLGRHLIQKLARDGAILRVAVRRPEFAGFLCPMGDVGQVTPIQANVRDDYAVARAIEGAGYVVNWAGTIFERGR
ncbi:MAG: NAD-dependent epimerase/dehydratase family protein, partial [Alphaproteobacteria bacterium]